MAEAGARRETSDSFNSWCGGCGSLGLMKTVSASDLDRAGRFMWLNGRLIDRLRFPTCSEALRPAASWRRCVPTRTRMEGSVTAWNRISVA